MSSTIHLSLFLAFLLFISPSIAQKSSSKPHTIVLPVFKDGSNNQHVTQIRQRTPFVSLNLTVDIGGQALWVDCSDRKYVSSSYKPFHCNSKNICPSNFGGCFNCFGDTDTPVPPHAGCNNHTCRVFLENQVNQNTANMEVTEDIFSLQSISGRFKFACGQRLALEMVMLQNLSKGVEGMAGLGRTELSLPSQLAATFNLAKKFSICLSSSTKASGALFFGDGPVTKSLTYTSLSKSSSTVPNSEYYIRVKSIKVNGKVVPVNTTLLNVNNFGRGGTKISTLEPYTILETSIYSVVTNAFAKELKHIPTVKARSPFKLCYDASKFSYTQAGPTVPPIDLVLNEPNIFWRIDGANALVEDGPGRLCLAFVDGADYDEAVFIFGYREAIIIGAHQLENHLLQFDLDNSKMGFSSSLLSQGTTCDKLHL